MRIARHQSSLTASAARTIAVTALVLALPAASWSANDESDGEDEEGLETLFVTAEKKVSDIQETGGSIVAFTQTMLEDRGIYDVKSITEYVPNVKIHTNVGGNTGFAVNIRGAIKGDPIISREPVVGLYVDEVYLANMAGILFDVLDLEAIEVLRGPQGTLYGRNTNGGAIKLRTRAPTDHVSLRNDLTFGNFDTLNNRTVLNMPVFGDAPDALLDFDALGSLNTRTSFAYLSRDGFVDAVSNDQIVSGATPTIAGADRLDDIDRWAVHHRTQWQPVDRLAIDYIFDKTHVRENPTAVQLSFVEPDDGNPFNPPPPGDNPLLNGVILGLFGFGVDISPFVRNTRENQIAQGFGANSTKLASDLDIWGHSARVTLELPTLPLLGDVTAKSITAHRRKKNHDAADVDGTGFRIFESDLHISHQQISQELQFNGSTDEGRVNYVTGVFFFLEDGKASNDQDFLQDAAFIPSGAGFMVDFFQKVQKRTWAGFGQLDYTPPVLDEKLTLSGGLRYTNERVELDVLNRNTMAIGVGNPTGIVIDTGLDGSFPAAVLPTAKRSFDDVSWLGRAMYQFTDEVMGYFKVSTGFLSGGFNARNVNNPNFGPAVNPFGVPFDSEKLLSYELGLRTDLLDRRVRFNATFFYYDYEDIQVSVFDPGSGGASTVVKNAGVATMWGGELELMAQPFEGAEINLGYGYTNARFDKFIDDLGAGPVDVSGSRDFTQTPEHSVVVGGQYTLPAFSWGTILGRMDWSWNSAVHFSDRPVREIDEASTWLLHGMIQVADVELPGDMGSGRFQFWVKNITDEKFKEFGFSLGPLGWAVNTYTDPRTYGATFVWEWEK